MSRKQIRQRLSELYRPQVQLVEDKIDKLLGLREADNDEQETEGERRRWVAAAS